MFGSVRWLATSTEFEIIWRFQAGRARRLGASRRGESNSELFGWYIWQAVLDSGVMVQGLGVKIEGLRVQGSGYSYRSSNVNSVSGFVLGIWSARVGIWDLGFRIWYLGYRGSECRFSCLNLRGRG